MCACLWCLELGSHLCAPASVCVLQGLRQQLEQQQQQHEGSVAELQEKVATQEKRIADLGAEHTARAAVLEQQLQELQVGACPLLAA